ncbi:hypothetical protein ACQKCU_02900 [Heyndrickxia sporothermodurans]
MGSKKLFRGAKINMVPNQYFSNGGAFTSKDTNSLAHTSWVFMVEVSSCAKGIIGTRNFPLIYFICNLFNILGENLYIMFRIVEVRKGIVNITFGFVKRVMFDHIGFLVSNEEKFKICKQTQLLYLHVEEGERRTFITTPYKFRIELQTHGI